MIRHTTYYPDRAPHILVPGAGDHIYSVQSDGASFTLSPEGDSEVDDVIRRDDTTTFFTKDGSSFRVSEGTRIVWERHHDHYLP